MVYRKKKVKSVNFMIYLIYWCQFEHVAWIYFCVHMNFSHDELTLNFIKLSSAKRVIFDSYAFLNNDEFLSFRFAWNLRVSFFIDITLDYGNKCMNIIVSIYNSKVSKYAFGLVWRCLAFYVSLNFIWFLNIILR